MTEHAHRGPFEETDGLNAMSMFDPSDARAFYRKMSDLEMLATHFVRRSYLEDLTELPRMQAIPGRALSMNCNSQVFVSHAWRGPNLPDDGILDAIRSFVPNREGIGLWIDYCCLPQARRDGTDDRSDAEKAFFKTQLQYVPTIILKSQLLVLWDAEHVNRAWCVVELLLADIFMNLIMKQTYHCREQLIDPLCFITQTYDPTEFCFVGGVKGTPVPKIVIPHSIKSIPGQYYNSLLAKLGLGPTRLTELLREVESEHIHQLFEENQLQCTNHRDIPVLKELLYKVCRFAGTYDVGAINWAGRIPYSGLLPYMMADLSDLTVRLSDYDF